MPGGFFSPILTLVFSVWKLYFHMYIKFFWTDGDVIDTLYMFNKKYKFTQINI